MRRYHLKVFDNRVEGTDAVYSESAFDEMLASTDRTGIVCVATSVTGTTVTLTVTFEHSPDRMYWSGGNETQIDAQSIVAGEVNLVGGQAFPGSGFGRLKIELGGTTPGANLQVFATGRDPLEGGIGS